MIYLIVFKKKDTYSYVLKRRPYLITHPLGHTNQYGKEVILIIPISKLMYDKKHLLKSCINKTFKKIINLLSKFTY